ncbi:restriction endonuclease-related protein [Spirosoma endophyticum]|uniref:REase associating with pPIWI RE domain-containing protein n=1 Tax=Spirosoma endophyticum TaxID=662367 RepID=A0A1I1FL71_9BACT|nr:hypothetical protein [Spirosoma endophyticum]SFB99752.1 hypothetical protein SAMN05216167_101252 [Spirosoma endophyticum]
MPQTILFDKLLLGLYELTNKQRQSPYPYPVLFQQVCQHLALQLSTSAPRTLQGWLNLFHQPIQSWWPASYALPKEFASTDSLLIHNRPSDEAVAYYYSVLSEIDATASPMYTTVAVENRLFRSLYLNLKDAYRDESNAEQREQIQQEYVQLRRFLIESPITTTNAIRRKFWSGKYVTFPNVCDFYEPCNDGQTQWSCHHCGPLHWEGNALVGIRQSICNYHPVEAEHIWQESSEREPILRIRTGIHVRTCFPGLPELFLFNQLGKRQQEQPSLLKAVELWPGVDQYDIRIEFANGMAWAIDVKDYQNPQRLLPELKTIDDRNGLDYRSAFYVIPNRWIENNPHYLPLLKSNTDLPASHNIVSSSQLLDRVDLHLKSIRKPRRKP